MAVIGWISEKEPSVNQRERKRCRDQALALKRRVKDLERKVLMRGGGIAELVGDESAAEIEQAHSELGG